MSDSGICGERWKANVLASALIIGFVGFVSVRLAGNGANLTWDDAEYLARAYDSVRYARSHSSNPAGQIARVGWTLLHQGFKPPLLVAWIIPWFFLFGPQRLLLVIWCATAVPFALLLIAAASVAARTLHPRAAPWAAVCLGVSPMSLEFGGKVMVETFLGLWILFAVDAAARIVERPSYRRAALLGIWLALATLTKASAFLLLAGPAMYFLVALLRERRAATAVGLLAVTAAVMLAIAGPWYVRNYRSALEHVRFAAEFDVLALGKKDESIRILRLLDAAGAIAGWGLLLTFAAAETARAWRGSGSPREHSAGRHFERMAFLGLAVSSIAVLFPSYFETRFLLPVWPPVAVVIGARCYTEGSASSRWAAALAAMLALSAVYSVATVERVRTRTKTYWDAGVAVAALVTEYGVRKVANVGDVPDWNIAKLRLASAFQPGAADCEFRDLSRYGPEELDHALEQGEVVFVLDQNLVPPLMLATPGMNRAYEALSRPLINRLYEKVELSPELDLPRLTVYVRKR